MPTPMNVLTLLAQLALLVSQMREASETEVIQLHSNVHIELRGPDGELKDVRDIHNTILTAGKNNLLASGAGSKYIKDYAYIAIGTGSTGAVIGDTALGTETVRALSTVSNPTAASIQFQYTFPAGTGTGAVTESGLDYQNTTSSALLARQTFSAINKGASDTLQMTWTLS